MLTLSGTGTQLILVRKL